MRSVVWAEMDSEPESISSASVMRIFSAGCLLAGCGEIDAIGAVCQELTCFVPSAISACMEHFFAERAIQWNERVSSER